MRTGRPDDAQYCDRVKTPAYHGLGNGFGRGFGSGMAAAAVILESANYVLSRKEETSRVSDLRGGRARGSPTDKGRRKYWYR